MRYARLTSRTDTSRAPCTARYSSSRSERSENFVNLTRGISPQGSDDRQPPRCLRPVLKRRAQEYSEYVSAMHIYCRAADKSAHDTRAAPTRQHHPLPTNISGLWTKVGPSGAFVSFLVIY